MKSVKALKEDIVKRHGVVIQEAEDGFSFQIPYRTKPTQNSSVLRAILSWGGTWDHVSVSLHNRVPTWAEMQFIKDLCFLPEECCCQLHPPRMNYINDHKHTLHIWRPQTEHIPQPPQEFV